MAGSWKLTPRLLAAPSAWAVFLVGTLLTLGAWAFARNQVKKERQALFDREAGRISVQLDGTISDHLDLLRACEGLFNVTDDVKPGTWREYVRQFQIKERYPGITSLGYAPVIPSSALAEFESKAKVLLTHADYHIHGGKDGAGLQSAPVLYVEPTSSLARVVEGFDLLSDSLRRDTIDRAIELGSPVATPRLNLIRDKQAGGEVPGFVIYVPLYQRHAAISSAAERRVALRGVLYAAIHTHELLADLRSPIPGMDIEVHDGRIAEPKALLFDANDHEDAATSSRFERHSIHAFAHREWSLLCATTPVFSIGSSQRVPSSILVLGGFLSVIFGLFTASLVDRRRHAEALARDLHESQALYRDLVEQSSDVVFQVDAEGRYTFMNQAMRDVLGYAPEEVLGHSAAEFNAREYQGATQEGQARLRSGGRVSNFPIRKVHKDGSERWVNLNVWPLRAADGQIVGNQGTFRDVTEQREAAAALEESEDRFRTVAETMSCIIFLFDQKVRYINPYVTQLFGYSPEEIIGQPFWILTHPDDRARVKAYAQARMRGDESPSRYEVRAVGRDGTIRWVDVTAGRVRLRGETLSLATVFDITERIDSQEAKLDMERKLRDTQKLESLGILAGGIAHDFNNLLGAILGNASLAEELLPSNSPARPPIENLQRTCERAAELTRQMLAYSGRGRFVVVNTDLNELVQAMASLLRVSIPKNHLLEFRLSANPLVVESDVAQIQQVVMNLLTNASEAIQAKGLGGGTITLTTFSCSLDEPSVGAVFRPGEGRPGTYACLQVEDNGTGMDATTQEKMFDPFFTTKFTGRGLGLAAMQGIVRGHGGGMHVESLVGRGTRFRVFLPLSDKAMEALPVTIAMTAQDHAGEGLILVVDDETDLRGMAMEVLASHGYDVLQAANGQEALDVFAREGDRIRAVVLDMTMPGMDGEAVFRRLQELRPGLPVLLSSGYSEQESIGRFGQDAPRAFLQKPYRSAQLLEGLKRALS
jgi:two-component system, cell cycle sensor histidine kinase and response regulator CckA